MTLREWSAFVESLPPRRQEGPARHRRRTRVSSESGRGQWVATGKPEGSAGKRP